jgi:hypothetical protein
MPDNLLTFNGINGATGDYGLPPMTGAELASFVRGEAALTGHRDGESALRDEREDRLAVALSRRAVTRQSSPRRAKNRPVFAFN